LKCFERKSLVLIILFCIFKITSVHAAPQEYNVKINDVSVQFTTAPIKEKEDILLPIREMYEIFGYNVNWDFTSKSVTCVKSTNKVTFKINDNVAQINGKNVNLPVPVSIIKSSIYAPASIISESLDLKIDILEKEKTVCFKSKNGSFISVSGYNNVLTAGPNIIATLLYKDDKSSSINKEIESANKLFTENNYLGAIRSYEKILQKISSKNNINEYAITMTNMGYCYINLALFANKEENTLKAISIFEEVLDKTQGKSNSIARANAYKHLGNAYINLFRIRNTEENINKSLDALNEALSLYDKELMPLIIPMSSFYGHFHIILFLFLKKTMNF